MTNNSPSKDQRENKQTRTAFQISLVTAIVTGIIAVYFSILRIEDIDQWRLDTENILSAIISFFAFVSAWLNKRGRSKLGIMLVLGAFALSMTLAVLFSAGMDIFMVVLLLVITFGISSNTLPSSLANKAILGSFIFALLFVLIGFFEPFERIYYPPSLPITLISIFLIIVYGALILRQYTSYPIRTKLILAFILLGSFSIGIAFVFTNINTRQILENNSQEKLLADASASANTINIFLQYSLDTVATTATYLDLRDYFLLSPEKRQGTQAEEQVQNLLSTLDNRNPDILSYGLLDINGRNIADSNTKNIGLSEAELDYFQLPLNANTTYISSVLYFPDEDTGFLFFSAPVHSETGDIVGVLRAKYRASVLQGLLSGEEHLASEEHLSSDIHYTNKGMFSMLFDGNHIFLAHETNPKLIGKIAYLPSAENIKKLREKFLVPSFISDEHIYHGNKELEERLSDFVTTPYFSTQGTTSQDAVSGAVTQLEIVPWLVITAQTQSTFFTPLRQQTQQALLVASILIILAALSGIGLTNILVAPIIRLKNTTQEFAEGNLNAKAPVETDDEIGSLSIAFNYIASRLGDTIETLEHSVDERTKDLEIRTGYLEGSSKISRSISSITNPDVLVKAVVKLIQEQFNLYYVGIFLLDPSKEWAVLRAGTGKAGEKMLAKKHQIKIGDGMIGWAIENIENRIALDVGEDAVRFDNPDLPETRSEGALPLRSRGRVLGALTVQSSEGAAFDASIINTLQIMADQIAVALDNAELFTQSEEALLAERRAYGQLSQQSWRTLTQEQTIPRIVVNEDGEIKPIENANTSIDISQTIEKDEPLQEDNLTAIIPIKNRDNVLGGIKIRKNKGENPWTKEELEITQAISEQLSVALESARLFDKAQRKAQLEAITSEILTKIGASMRMDAILQTTVKELGEALDSPEVTFRLTSSEKEQPTAKK